MKLWGLLQFSFRLYRRLTLPCPVRSLHSLVGKHGRSPETPTVLSYLGRDVKQCVTLTASVLVTDGLRSKSHEAVNGKTQDRVSDAD